MLQNKNVKKMTVVFIVVLVLGLGCLGVSIAQVNAYNSTNHQASFTGASLFAEEGGSPEGAGSKDVSVAVVPRSSTWTKAFDFNNEGITEHNYQAYTYDFTVTNNTNDEVKDFSYKLTFSKDVYLSSA